MADLTEREQAEAERRLLRQAVENARREGFEAAREAAAEIAERVIDLTPDHVAIGSTTHARAIRALTYERKHFG